MKLLPVNISNFEKLITGNYIYVDKTKIIYQLLQYERLFFFSRPRRFGKSLLVSLLKELFSANKKLFCDTWIGGSDYAWIEYPIIQLDFSLLSIHAQEFEMSLGRMLDLIGLKNDTDISQENLLNIKLQMLVQELSKKNKVVILIDEYDSPLLSNLDNLLAAEKIQKIMRSFFSAIKSLDAFGYIHAIFITGVTKFSKTSIFSGMNNLDDITMDPQAALLLGYTKAELEFYFVDYIEAFAHKKNCSSELIYDILAEQYNGYRFSEQDSSVYNPFSVIRSLSKKKFANYWFETGTPSFLIGLLRKQYDKVQAIETLELSGQALGTFDIENIHIIPILLQAGYFTIKYYNSDDDTYTIGYPNKEVYDAFCKYLLIAVAQGSAQDIEHLLVRLKKSLDENDINIFCILIKSLFANIPYQLHDSSERYYHSLLQLLVVLIGVKGESEISSDKGRIDMVISTKHRIVIFEFKFNSSPLKAVEQIVAKCYYEKYMHYNKPISLVGMSFNTNNKELNIDWVKKDL